MRQAWVKLWDRCKAGCERVLQLGRLITGRDRRVLGLAVVLMLAAGTTMNIVPALLGRLVNALAASQGRGSLGAEWPGLAASYLSVVAAVFLTRELSQLLRKYLVQSVCIRTEEGLTTDLVGRLLRADLGFYATNRIGTLQNRVRRGVEGFVQVLRLSFQDLCPAVITVACTVVYAFCCGFWLGVLMLLAVPLTLLIAAWHARLQKATRRDVQRTEEALAGTLFEQLGGMEYLRAANTHEQEIARVAGLAAEIERKEVRQHVRAAVFDVVKALNDWGFQTAVITCAVLLILFQHAPLGTLLTFWYLCFNIITPLRDSHRVLHEINDNKVLTEDLQLLLREPADQSFGTGDTATRAAGAPAVEVRDVMVEYRDAGGEMRRALDGLSLSIGAGELVGVAGRSGSGKSTLARLLLRLAHPAAGSVRLAGTPLEELSRTDIGRLAAYVGQTPFLFAGTVADNIAYGCGPVTSADIERAAKLAGIHGEIVARPGGYAAAVAEGGGNLSGGQRQRLALARAFLKWAPLLVLDEATSALDPAGERRVLLALARRGGRTVVFVTHRLASLLGVDRVLVLDGGRLAEEGSYAALARRGGTFAGLLRQSKECGRRRRRRAGRKPAPQGAENAAERMNSLSTK
jgi:ATP-binding cassette subfamily B protein